jgi:hypothetical protein
MNSAQRNRYVVATALVAAAAALAPVKDAAAELPKKPAPQGMAEVPTGTAAGRILTSRMGGTASARKMLQALRMVSAEYFDGPPKVTRAFGDPADRSVQAAFTAKLKGVPVRGVIAVAMDPEGGDGGQGTILFGEAKGFAKSFPALAAKQGGGGAKPAPAAAAPPVRLTPQSLPDGSGQISLPPGFRVTGAYQGTADIVGPDGAVMALGAPILCTRPEAAAMFPGTPPVDFNDPVRAALDYMNYQSRKAGARVSVRVLDAKPVPGWTAGRAAFVRYTAQAGGKTFEGFGLFSIAPTDINQALLYMTYMAAPTESYRKHFPGMLRAWGTWSVNPEVFRQRLTAAAQSMRGMSDIITGVDARRQETYARVNQAWGDYIRDETTWANPDTGARYKVSNALTNGGGIPTQNGVALQPVPLGDL